LVVEGPASNPAIILNNGGVSLASTNGKLGIGLLSPQYKFHIQDNVLAGQGIRSGTTAFIDKKPSRADEVGSVTNVAIEARNGFILGSAIKAVNYSSSGYGVTGVSGTANGYGLRGEGRGLGAGTQGEAYGTGYGISGKANNIDAVGGYFTNEGGGNALHTAGGWVTLDTLAGTGTRMVVADATGKLGTQPIAGFSLPYVATGPLAPEGTTFQITNGDGGSTISGISSNTTLGGTGVQGIANAEGGTGVFGKSNATAGISAGVIGRAVGEDGIGLWGENTATTGSAVGIKGTSASTDGTGVQGIVSVTSGITTGVQGSVSSPDGRGVVGFASAATGETKGVYGTAKSPAGAGGYFAHAVAAGTALRTARGGVQFDVLAGTGSRMVVADASGRLSTQTISGFSLPYAATGGLTPDGFTFKISNGDAGVAVAGASTNTTTGGVGVQGSANSEGGVGVYGVNNATTGAESYGVVGRTFGESGISVWGESKSATGITVGVYGTSVSTDGIGIQGVAKATSGFIVGVSGSAASPDGRGVAGFASAATGETKGVYGSAKSPAGAGGYFTHTVAAGTALRTVRGGVQFDVLAGTGNRMVVADANGKLTTQAIPTGGGGGDQWVTSGNNIYNSNTGNTGIGTNTPVAALNVAVGKTVLFGADTLNTGVKMMWLPARKAFRAGEIADGYDYWNTAKIGNYSFSAGLNTLASGSYSASFGTSNATADYSFATGAANASGLFSSAFGSSAASAPFATAGGSARATVNGATAFGENSAASGAWSIASGYYSEASGTSSTALGASRATGDGATAIGFGISAKADGGTTVGMYNNIDDNPVKGSPQATDRIFQVGNGTATASLSNAVTVLRNGNTGFGVLNPSAKLEVAGQVKITGGSPAEGRVLTSDANGLATWRDVAGGGAAGWGLNGNTGTDNTNFIGTINPVDLNFKTYNQMALQLTSVGALIATGTNLGTAPNLGAGSRMMWIPASSAFRAGGVSGTHWNNINIGAYSVAMGHDVMATSYASIALGDNVSAGNRSAIAMGQNASASGPNSLAIGTLVNASWYGSMAIGDQEYGNTMSTDAGNQMYMRFKGGYRLYTTTTQGAGVMYAELPAGQNSWAPVSDRKRKENFVDVNGEDFLNKIAQFKLSSWNYKGQDPSIFRHYGPMAQDFYAAFGQDKFGRVGNDTTIGSSDLAGVSLIAIQALEKRTSNLKDENTKLKATNEALLKEIALLKQQMTQQTADVTKKLEALEKLVMTQVNQQTTAKKE